MTSFSRNPSRRGHVGAECKRSFGCEARQNINCLNGIPIAIVCRSFHSIYSLHHFVALLPWPAALPAFSTASCLLLPTGTMLDVKAKTFCNSSCATKLQWIIKLTRFDWICIMCVIFTSSLSGWSQLKVKLPRLINLSIGPYNKRTWKQNWGSEHKSERNPFQFRNLSEWKNFRW